MIPKKSSSSDFLLFPSAVKQLRTRSPIARFWAENNPPSCYILYYIVRKFRLTVCSIRVDTCYRYFAFRWHWWFFVVTFYKIRQKTRLFGLDHTNYFINPSSGNGISWSIPLLHLNRTIPLLCIVPVFSTTPRQLLELPTTCIIVVALTEEGSRNNQSCWISCRF